MPSSPPPSDLPRASARQNYRLRLECIDLGIGPGAVEERARYYIQKGFAPPGPRRALTPMEALERRYANASTDPMGDFGMFIVGGRSDILRATLCREEGEGTSVGSRGRCVYGTRYADSSQEGLARA
jgi:hypothetical protein